MNTDKRKIIFYDGYCRLCNRSVLWVLQNDSKHLFRYAPIGGKVYAELVGMNSNLTSIDSLIVWTNGKFYTQSDAALQIVRELKLSNFNVLWNGMLLFKAFPRSFRDEIYSFIAKKRYVWFGKLEVCQIPNPEHTHLFLD